MSLEVKQDFKLSDLDLTKQTFEPMYGRALSDQEAFTIRHNLVNFFETLMEIDDELKEQESNEKPNNRSTNSTSKTK